MKDLLLENPFVYLLWQMPFNEQKITPVRALERLWQGRKILDIGCGPGINASVFSSAKEYLGIDINPAYIKHACKKHPHRIFRCHDVLAPFKEDYTPDIMFSSSLLHHLDDSQVDLFFGRMREIVTTPTDFILVDLIMPEHPSVARFLAQADRGDHARSIEHWREILQKHLDFQDMTPFTVTLGGLILWNFFLLAGKLKSQS